MAGSLPERSGPVMPASTEKFGWGLKVRTGQSPIVWCLLAGSVVRSETELSHRLPRPSRRVVPEHLFRSILDSTIRSHCHHETHLLSGFTAVVEARWSGSSCSCQWSGLPSLRRALHQPAAMTIPRGRVMVIRSPTQSKTPGSSPRRERSSTRERSWSATA